MLYSNVGLDMNIYVGALQCVEMLYCVSHLHRSVDAEVLQCATVRCNVSYCLAVMQCPMKKQQERCVYFPQILGLF